MKIEELFRPSEMPKEMNIVKNHATWKEERKCYVPEVYGWDATTTINSPSDIINSEWIESPWENRVTCVCPAKIEGARLFWFTVNWTSALFC